jgi:hypothetical protein
MSTKKSTYEKAFIESNDQKRTVDIKGGIIAFDYYEDIFSPTITAKIRVVNDGNSIQAPDKEGTPDGARQSIYNGLPLRGGERVSIKVAANSDKNKPLDFSNVDDYFYVSSITEVISNPQSESFLLNLTSREAITNETVRVTKKYPTSSTIDASIRSILENVLRTKKIGTLDKTQNKYGFIGNLRKPFTVCTWLSAKAVPGDTSGDGTAGFVFYQTKDGFQFRSIDGLMGQESKATYTLSGAQETYDTEGQQQNSDFNILDFTTDKNQNLIEKLRLGTYSSYRMFYNPLTFEFTDPQKGIFKLEDYVSKAKNLGDKLKLPKLSGSDGKSLGDTPTRIITQCLDIGTMEKDVSTDENADPFKYQSQALMRYNVLFTQAVDMLIPLNTNLSAGDIINCQFPKISSGDKEEYDQEQSGLYMIKELCHHFDSESSYTSMKLIRDTFGRYGANNKK